MIDSDLPAWEISRDPLIDERAVGPFPGRPNQSAGGRKERRRARFITRVPPGELAGCNQLSVRAGNRSAAPVLVEMVLSGPSAGGPEDKFLLFSGGRESLGPGQERIIRFPNESFGFYGQGREWRNVSRIEVVFKKEENAADDDPPDVVVSPLQGGRRLISPGPRLTEEGLSRRLRPGPAGGSPLDGPLNRPERTALSPHPYPEGQADEILAGIIMGQRLPFPLPWGFSPDGAQEWTHFLNRHHFLRPVWRALAETGENRYLRFIEEIITDWIRRNPVPLGSNGGAGPSWETLSAAWRLREWLGVRQALGDRSGLGRENRRLILRSCWEHGRHLMDHRGHPNNWIIIESAALALAGLELSCFREAPAWRREGIGRLAREIPRQFLADGVHFECSPLYQALCLQALLEVREVAEKREVRLPAAFRAPLERAADYLAAICRPGFTWPSLNDSGSALGDYSPVMLMAGKVFGRKDFIWLGTKGARGRPPDQETAVFRSAGIAVVRSGPPQVPQGLLFRAGPPGRSHLHEDALSLDISVAGVPCLVDPGITAYAPGPLTRWYRSPAAHNMILIDGRGPVRSGLPGPERVRPPGRDFRLSRAGRGPVLRGVCRDYWGAGRREALRVIREAALGEGGLWIIRDRIEGLGRHRVDVCWQFFPGRVRILRETGAVCYWHASGPGCILLLSSSPLRPKVIHSKGRIHPPGGWVSIQGQDVPADHLRFCFRAVLPLDLTWEIRPQVREDT